MKIRGSSALGLTAIVTQLWIPRPVSANSELGLLERTAEILTNILIGNNPFEGRPRVRGSGGSRGECQIAREGLPDLFTIVPDNQVWEALPTSSTRPVFWVYSPYSVAENTRIEFQLYNRSGSSIFEPIFTGTVSGFRPGVLGLTLPDSAPSLEVGNEYQWFIKVYCDEDDASAARDMAHIRLADSDSEMIWYDQVSELATPLQSGSDAISRQAWENFLRNWGLGDIADQPVEECCQVIQEDSNTLPD
jgi:hypothetical protein